MPLERVGCQMKGLGEGNHARQKIIPAHNHDSQGESRMGESKIGLKFTVTPHRRVGYEINSFN